MVIATVIITTATTTGYKSDNKLSDMTTVTVKFLSLASLACPDTPTSLAAMLVVVSSSRIPRWFRNETRCLPFNWRKWTV